MTSGPFLCRSTRIVIFLVMLTSVCTKQISGPVFIIEPKGNIEYLNTEGAHMNCNAYGDPSPVIKWFYKQVNGQNQQVEDNELISVLSNGTLVLRRFSSANQAPQHGGLQYMCRASNMHGTIVSAPVTIRAVLASDSQRQQHAQVYDELVIEGNTALLKCHMPSFYNNHLYVKAWIREDNFVIKANSTNKNMAVTSSGKLHIKHVTADMDTKLGYWCQVGDRVTGETFLSETAGRLKLTGGVGTAGMPPKISDFTEAVGVMEGQELELVCLAAGQPTPQYTWYCGTDIPDKQCLKPGSDTITKTVMKKAGTYIYKCVAQNQYGRDTKSTIVVVRELLKVFIEPSFQVVNSGQEAELECKIKGHPIDVINWKLNGHDLEFTNGVERISKRKIKVRARGKVSEGMYQCFASNKWESVQGTAQLLLGDLAPSFLETFKPRTLQPGPSISLKCIATGRPPPGISWSFNGGTLKQNRRFILRNSQSKNGTVTSKLIIKNIRSLDGGIYGCTARNKINSVGFEQSVKVYGLPKVHDMEDVIVADGQDVVLSCYVSGYPIQSIRWIRGDDLGYLPERARDFGNGTLLISKVENGNDEGRYTCVASNGRGQKDQKDVSVNVLMKPKIMESQHGFAKLESGKPFSTICSVVGGDEPIKISWLKNNKSISLGIGTDIATTKMYSVLQIREVSEDHAGNYTCLAQNKAGVDTMTVQLQVLVSPKWEVAPQDVVSSSESTIKIPCFAKGFPKPGIKWFRIKNEKMTSFIFDDGKHKIEDNGTLVLKNIDENDEGYYSCVVSNKIAPDLQKKIKITIGDKPVARFINDTSVVTIGQSLNLVCQAQSESPADIIWQKDRKLLKNDSKILIVTQVKTSEYQSMLSVKNVENGDQGSYFCKASNKYGNASSKVVISISDTTNGGFLTVTSTPKSSTTAYSATTSQISTTSEISIETEPSLVDQNDASENNEGEQNLGTGPDEPLESTNGIFDGVIDMGNVLFIVPVVVIVILLIAVIVTLVVYMAARRRDNSRRNDPGMTMDRRSMKGTLERGGNKMAHYNKDYYYASSGENPYRDSRYGRLERPPVPPVIPPPSNRSSGAYEIPDYYSGTARPYATLQLSSRRPSDAVHQQHPFAQAQSSL